jgi:preprotein translocase subunit SecA
MAPIYHALELSVGTITEDMDLEMRRKNYACDITYCSNKQIVFDYLRDRLTMGQVRDRRQLELERLYKDEARIDQLLLRGLCFAIVDEADSVLIDEARTPLVISKGSSNDAQELAYQEALDLAKQLQEGDDFYILGREHRVVLREEGCIRLEQLSHSLSAIWLGEKRREFLITQALSAIYLYHSNKQYIVKNDKVHIVDEYTGRAMEDRAWEQGLHQMIEAKEGCEITGNREVLAKISYQKFFRRYLQLAGMTGTGSEVAAELRSVYGLRVVHVPQNKKPQRVGYKDQVFWKRDDKWQAVVERIKAVHKKGQPVLVGTRSVADSEYVSELLRQEKLPYCVLNARNDHQEAEIIAQAGQRTRITVATNMAGRGTDISLGPGVEELGGLHVIATERHDSHRIDRQLFGRCGRQGDPGSYEVILSLEDELVMLYLPQLIYEYIQKHPKNNSSAGEFGRLMIVLAQRLAEQRHRQTRHQLMKLDLQMGDKLAFTGFIE